MNIKHSNPCIRCGKERVMLKQWKEKITNFWGVSIISHEEWICEDKECQKIVDEKLKAAKDKKELLEHEREERIKNSRNKRYGLRLSKKS